MIEPQGMLLFVVKTKIPIFRNSKESFLDERFGAVDGLKLIISVMSRLSFGNSCLSHPQRSY